MRRSWNGELPSKLVTRDHRRGEVMWEQGDIADLKGKVVSLRFTLRKAGLYSYWVDD